MNSLLQVEGTDLERFGSHLFKWSGCRGSSCSVSAFGFRSGHRGAILGSFCLFLSHLRLSFVHDKMSIIKASPHSGVRLLSFESFPLPAGTSLYLHWASWAPKRQREDKTKWFASYLKCEV